MHTSPHLLQLLRDNTQHQAELRRKQNRKPQSSNLATQPSNPNPTPQNAENLFTIHTGNNWLNIDNTPPEPDKLFGNFWHRNELCILFADTNIGKSILAVQLGHELARGAAIEPFANNTQAAPVLYIDFELSTTQFRSRYRDHHASHNFAPNFYRAEFNPDAQMPPEFKTFEQYINGAIECAIQRTAAQVLIIDNISCLRTGAGTHANEALTLIRHLKALKSRHNLSILVLAHTPKRNPANPISQNDLHGSKMLMNFADSAFTIGQSNAHPNHRYLKQVKQRSGTEMYGADNVCLFSLQQQFGYLHYKFLGYSLERDHLRRHNYNQRVRLQQQALQLRNDGLSQRQIAAQLNLSAGTVNKLLNWV